MVKILSFGSNCEVGIMINRYYNNNIYSQLFNWTNITLKNLILCLSNKDSLKDFNNILILYRIFDNEKNIFSSKYILDIKNFPCANHYLIHIDYEFYLDNNFLFWSHGTNKDLNDILNSNENDLFNYRDEILSKYSHLLSKTLEILNNDFDVIKIYLKLLKNEYDIESIINIHNIVVNKENIYLGIIYENDEEINIELKNTILVRVDKLTAHYEASRDHLYNTQSSYFHLFEQLDKLSNS